MRSLLLAASILGLAACGNTTETAATNDAIVSNDMAAVDNMIADDGMNAGMGGNIATSSGAVVTVSVSGVTANSGPVLVALQSESEFGKSAGTYTTKVEPTGTSVTATLSGVPAGRYAAAVVQDTNRDGTFTIGATGPTEPYGFSGTAQSGAPAFAPAAFDVSATGGSATVALKSK
ncbi:DUF2141 domain-containing protein [Sphingomonas kaistensis]|uniref:DUF2141 domain-containing protein n=1 Tax=Sphingomonas kaistensis TaxID=298708 RepID=A0ABZ2G1Z2_9SPHN